MRPTRKQHKLDTTFRMLAHDEVLELHLTGLSLGLWGDDVNELRLQVETDLETLRRMEKSELCNLTVASRSPAAIEPFTADQPVKLELRLDALLLQHIPSNPAEAADVLMQAARGTGEDALRADSAWYVLNVKQSRGAVSTGYRTTWFEPSHEQVRVDGLPLMAQVVEFLREKDFYFEQDAENPEILTLKNQGDNASWSCFATTDEERNLFAFYSVSPFDVTPERMQAAAEYICRANFGLMVGNFELDYDDGTVRFKTSADVEGATLKPLLDSLLQANLYLFDLYFPGLRAVVFEGASPADAQP